MDKIFGDFIENQNTERRDRNAEKKRMKYSRRRFDHQGIRV
jgi:hypothetical protein